jgi:hypothetical protein
MLENTPSLYEGTSADVLGGGGVFMRKRNRKKKKEDR